MLSALLESRDYLRSHNGEIFPGSSEFFFDLFAELFHFICVERINLDERQRLG